MALAPPPGAVRFLRRLPIAAIFAGMTSAMIALSSSSLPLGSRPLAGLLLLLRPARS